MKIATACTTLALALSACGSSPPAAKTETTSVSATSSTTRKSFTVTTSAASASDSDKASASSGTVLLPADITISAPQATSGRTVGVEIDTQRIREFMAEFVNPVKN